MVLSTSASSRYPAALVDLSLSNATGKLIGLYGTLEVSQGRASVQEVVLSDQGLTTSASVTREPANRHSKLLIVQFSDVDRTRILHGT